MSSTAANKAGSMIPIDPNRHEPGTRHSSGDHAGPVSPTLAQEVSYLQGTGNTLDLSGFSQAATVNLNADAFSSAKGLTNNIAIAQGTFIVSAVGGSGNDTITGNAADNTQGNAGNDRLLGNDTLAGGAGSDVFQDSTADLSGDRITDIAAGE